jgi:hypothetical protein
MSSAHVVTAFPNLTKIAHMQQTGERLFPNVEEAEVYIKGYIHQLSYRLVRSRDPAKHAKDAAESRARNGKANRESNLGSGRRLRGQKGKKWTVRTSSVFWSGSSMLRFAKSSGGRLYRCLIVVTDAMESLLLCLLEQLARRPAQRSPSTVSTSDLQLRIPTTFLDLPTKILHGVSSQIQHQPSLSALCSTFFLPFEIASLLLYGTLHIRHPNRLIPFFSRVSL